MACLRQKAGPVRRDGPRRRGSASRTAIRLHTSRSLLAFSDTTRRLGIPSTTVERTLIDIAASDPKDLKRAVEQAFVTQADRPHPNGRGARASDGRAGTNQLRRELAGLLPQLPFTRSELERRFLKLVKIAGLPDPVVNRHQQAHRVDFHWPAHNLVVETDGRGIHDNPHAFEEDCARNLDLELAGLRVIRALLAPGRRAARARVAELLGPGGSGRHSALRLSRSQSVPFPP